MDASADVPRQTLPEMPAKNRDADLLPPLPQGEGRGEGEGRAQGHRPRIATSPKNGHHYPPEPAHISRRTGLRLLAAAMAMGVAAFSTSPSSAEPAFSGDLLVAAAADLKFALDEVIAGYGKTHPQVTVKATYGSSGNLFAQISQGAPFDLFLSADASFPRRLVAAGKADGTSSFIYGIGRLVVWVPKASGIDVEKAGMRALLDPRAAKIAIANPAHAPYGAAAVAALDHYGIHAAVKDRLVLGENVAQAAQFVGSGAADIGIIARSLAVAPKMAGTGRWWEVPAEAHPRLAQGGVVLTGGRNAAAARELRAVLIGKEGRAVLARYGFVLPDK